MNTSDRASLFPDLKTAQFIPSPSSKDSTVQQFEVGSRKLFGRLMDYGSIQEVFHNDEYGNILRLLDRSRTHRVLDLGANIGCFSLCLLETVPSSVVVAIEPSEATFRILNQNFSLLQGARLNAVHGAVASERGKGLLSLCEVSTSFRLEQYVDSKSRFSSTEQVSTYTIEDLLDMLPGRGATLIKMDIEGAEAQVVNAEGKWMKRTESLVIELHTDRIKIDSLVATLREEFPFIVRVNGRASSTKPLLWCTRCEVHHSTFSIY